MTHLNIQQGLNIEVVSTNIIKKLYEAALSVPEPLEGELDAAYMSGNLLVDKSYRAWVEYLTNRFDDLHINVTNDYYIPFEDSALLQLLMSGGFSTDGVGITLTDAANATFTNSTFNGNTNITSFPEFKYFTKANTNPPNELFKDCTNLSNIDLSEINVISLEEFGNTGLSGALTFSHLSVLGQSSFSNCTGITSIDFTGSDFDIIKKLTFSNCSNLASVILPTTLITFGETWSTSPFNGTKIEQIIFPYGFKHSAGALLYGTWGKYCKYIQYPSTVETISLHDIYKNTDSNRITCYVVILATNPPVINLYNNYFNISNVKYARFYVPDETVYKTDSKWSSIADYIFPISQLQTDSPNDCWIRYQANKDYGVPLNNS